MNGRVISTGEKQISGRILTGDYLIWHEKKEYQESQALGKYDEYLAEYRLSSLEEEMNFLRKEIKKFETVIANIASIEVEILKDIKEPTKWTRKEAKKAILELFEKDKELGYNDIIEKMGINLNLIIEICEELEKEKSIKTIK